MILVDVRSARSLENSDQQAAGSVRLDPDAAVDEARRLRLPKDAWLIAWCA